MVINRSWGCFLKPIIEKLFLKHVVSADVMVPIRSSHSTRMTLSLTATGFGGRGATETQRHNDFDAAAQL